MHQNFKYFLQNWIWWSKFSNFSLLFYEKAAVMNFIGKNLCRSLFLNKVSCIQAKERLLHKCFTVVLPNIWECLFFAKHIWVTASAKYPFLFVMTTSATKKICLSTLDILNIFETNTVNCLRTALCGGPLQTVSYD